MARPLGITEDGRIGKTCPICKGSGKVSYRTPKGYTKMPKCHRCNGTGIIIKLA